MIADLTAFSAEQFDPKQWVNSTCSARPSDEPVDKYLSEVEMKLQLLAEDIAASLEELSSHALLRVPRAARETNRVRDDALSLRQTVSGILHRLEQAEGSSAQSVAALARVDSVKQHMEAARDTLQDAAGLAQLSASVEEVFASGDLPRVAETLASMRRCLAVVGEVPEFADVKRQLATLEDRLEQMVQPRLSDALNQRKVDATQALRDILIAIGRYGALEQHYTRVRLRPLRRMWEEFDSAGTSEGGYPSANSGVPGGPNRAQAGVRFAEWLPRFYDEVLLVVEQEVRWCAVAFPEEHQRLISHLLVETMAAIASSFSARIDAATQEASSAAAATMAGSDVDSATAAAQSASRLGTLIALHNMTGAFARNVQHLLTEAGTTPAEVAGVLRAIYMPFEAHKQRYGELEKGQLAAEIVGLDLRGAISKGVGARGVELSETVRRMEASVPEAMVALEAAVERCLNFTGGSEAEALVRTLDEVMLLLLSHLFEVLRSLRPVCGLESKPSSETPGTTGSEGSRADRGEDADDGEGDLGLGGDMVVEEEEWALVQGALQLLAVSESLGSRSAVFEASLRATLSRLTHRLLPAVGLGGADGSQPVAVSSSETGGGPGDLAKSGSLGLDGPGGGPRKEAAGAGFPSMDASVLRLADAPEKAQRLASLLEQAQDPRFHALPRTAQRVQAFQESVGELVYDVLISKVRRSLAGLAQKPVWGAEEEENAFDLPSFSAYPENYITVIGEYLLQLPQQLEPLAVGDSSSGTAGGSGGEEGDLGDDQSYFATEWMFKVAEGATALYIEHVRMISALSERGAQQLAADIEYLCNVLSALSMATPPVLATFQACLAVPKDGLADLVAAEAGPGGSLDSPTARLVAKMRKVSLD